MQQGEPQKILLQRQGQNHSFPCYRILRYPIPPGTLPEHLPLGSDIQT